MDCESTKKEQKEKEQEIKDKFQESKWKVLGKYQESFRQENKIQRKISNIYHESTGKLSESTRKVPKNLNKKYLSMKMKSS